MAVVYRIYANDGAGGPVDLSSPVATVPAASQWVAPALGPDEDWTFLVRVYDTVSGLEEQGSTARVRVVSDASSDDVSGRPNPVIHLDAAPAGSGAILATWAHPWPRDWRSPTGFKVWCQAGAGPVNFGLAPAATVPATRAAAFSASLGGLTAGGAYRVAVRAYNAAADDGSAGEVGATAGDVSATAPAAPAASTPWA